MLKKTVPVAFSTQCPVRPNVVFIDGQIKLMKSQSIRTWNSFVELQFRRTIEKAFETGARVVVLGFDNYVHVPTAKNMTQRKRMQDVQALEFCADAELPSAIPENWDAAIKNRTFKTKVIGLVLRSLRAHFQHEAGSTLILDYMGTPEVLGRPMQLPSWLEVSETSHTAPLLKRGECDIKAFTWADMGPLLIESTDGDFIALGLIQTNPNRRIILHRIKTNIKPPGGVVTGNQQASGKLKREYEFVDISMLHKYLCRDEHLRASCLDDNSEDNEEKAENEENKINSLMKERKWNVNIIIYGKNWMDKKVNTKYEQLKKLGFQQVSIYSGGLFEWLLLQDIYGEELFQTTNKELDILKYKPSIPLSIE